MSEPKPIIDPVKPWNPGDYPAPETYEEAREQFFREKAKLDKRGRLNFWLVIIALVAAPFASWAISWIYEYLTK